MKILLLFSLVILTTSCSFTKITFTQKGFFPFSSADTILLTLDRLPEISKDFALKHSANITCPTIYYADGKFVDDALFRKGVNMATLNRADSASLKRIKNIVHATHLIDCYMRGNDDLNRINIYPSETELTGDWLSVYLDVYDLTTGKQIHQIITTVRKSSTSIENKNDQEVLRIHRSEITLFEKGFKKGIQKLFRHCQ